MALKYEFLGVVFTVFGLLALAFIPVFGQQLSFRNYSVSDGLCQNTVWCIYQDSSGFMWFGTKDGLNRFDGITFKSYKDKSISRNGLGNLFIRTIIQYDANTLWIGTDAGIYTYDYNKEEFHSLKVYTAANDSIVSPVNALTKASDSTIWIATLGQGAFNYHTRTGKLIQYKHSPTANSSLSNNFVNHIYETRDGSIWLSTLGGGLNQLLKSNKSIVRYTHNANKPGTITDNTVYTVFEDSHYNLWVGTENGGLNLLDRVRETFIAYKATGSEGDISSNTVRQIFENKPGELFIGTEKGLNVFYTEREQFIVYQHKKNDYKSISDNAIYAISKDREGGVWVGTYFGGVNYIPKSNKQVEHYYPTGGVNALGGRAVSAFLEDRKGRFWVGTEDGGLNLFDNKEQKFTQVLSNTNFQNVHSLVEDKNGTIWIGTFLTGLVNYNPETGVYKNYLHNENNPNSLSNNNVFSVFKDNDGMIWVGTISGINIYDRSTDSFKHPTQLQLDRIYIYDILQDSQGNMWFATYGNGIIFYDKKQHTWKQYLHRPNDNASLSNNKVIVIHEDSKQRLWFGTEGGGLNLLQDTAGAFRHISYDEGVISNVIFGILEDADGYLWISTNNGLIKYFPCKEAVAVYGDKDGFQGTQFNYKAFYKGVDGKMYFGGINGFNAFYPENILQTTYVPPVKIVNFQLFNKDVTVGGKSPLTQTISQTSTIRLAHNQSVISFEFVALSYTSPTKIFYSYMLEGFDKEWISAGSQRKVTYTNLPAGEYIFSVKASNSDGVGNEDGTSLRLIITPPWWETKTAYIVYLLLCILLFFVLRYYILKSIRQQHERQSEAARIQKERDFYNQKIQFFTTIAHEIRTPLTLIIGPLENIRNEHQTEKSVHEQLELMDKNAQRLLNLVNQLLDFRKVEEYRYYLSTEKTNVIQLVKNIYNQFNVNSPKKIKFRFHSKLTELSSWLDIEVFTKILSNLLSNAMKFTKSTIDVCVDDITFVELPVDCKTHPCIIIHVKDNGNGIDPKLINDIFQPYYQLSDSGNVRVPGTGIGLALAKSLTELHNGLLMASSTIGIGSVFTIAIPLMLENGMAKHSTETISHLDSTNNRFIVKRNPETIDNKSKTGSPSILIVEDNVEILTYLKQCFDDENYHIVTATNGEKALLQLSKYEIDIVLSDVMMPGVDGFELCKSIKEDIETSHIPVILITAKSGSESAVEGLELGADAYLTKPFSVKQLRLQVHNILQSRRLLRERFHSSLIEPQTLSYNKTDQKFLDAIIKVVEENLLVSNFGVEELSREAGISRSGLHKKLKKLIGLGPNELIRSVRLKHAAKMIATQEYSVSEVAYSTGFSSPSYFTKCFTREFGVNPKEFTLDNLNNLS